MNTKLKRNISIGYVYNFFLQLNITSAIWVLYLAFNGMSLIEIGILESIYHITGLLFELPSGALADLYGRKLCVVLGRIVNLISCILMITSKSFMGFAISFIFSSAAMNLNSGAAEALIFDSLKELGEEENYKKIWGQLAFVISIAQGTAVLLGGIYAYWFESKLKLGGTLMAISSLNITALTGLAFLSKFSVFFYILTTVTGGLAFTIFSDYINSGIPSEYRATILSFDSLCFSLFMIFIFPFVGFIAQRVGFSITFGVMAIAYFPVLIFLMKKLTKHSKEKLMDGEGTFI